MTETFCAIWQVNILKPGKSQSAPDTACSMAGGLMGMGGGWIISLCSHGRSDFRIKSRRPGQQLVGAVDR